MTTQFEQNVLEMSITYAKQNDKIDKAMSLINSIDFSMVKAKLMDEEEGQGWDKDYTDYVEVLYKRYLCMIYVNPEGSTVPTKEIDLFWHQHILDTRAYVKDCEKIFGKFLHHFPYFGMRGEEDAQNLLDSFEETKIAYFQLFGEDYCSGYENQESSRCHKCSSKCHKCSSGCGMKCTTCKSS